MSPHRAGATSDSYLIAMEQLAELLNTAARGQIMANQVDLVLGY